MLTSCIVIQYLQFWDLYSVCNTDNTYAILKQNKIAVHI